MQIEHLYFYQNKNTHTKFIKIFDFVWQNYYSTYKQIYQAVLRGQKKTRLVKSRVL